jgi:hypothetical protein
MQPIQATFSMKRRFASKIDGKLAALGITVPLVAAAVLLLNGTSYGGPPWWTVLPLVVTALLVGWMLLSTWYAFAATSLIVRCGPFSWRIPLEQIFAVHETDSLRSGPALSMDRLEISFGDNRRILISPRDKSGFLQELQRQVPRMRLERDGFPPRT